MTIFLSQAVRDLIIAEIIEHEEECGNFNDAELNNIEHWLLSEDSERLFREYQNYFGVCVGEPEPC